MRRATVNGDAPLSCFGNFYPRSPCGERHKRFEAQMCNFLFLSTLSLRRATYMGVTVLGIQHNFYPRSPCGERRVHFDNYNLHCVISIHALLAESDCVFWMALNRLLRFLSTLSLRRATIISPHSTPDNGNFYPRSPCGERPTDMRQRLIEFRFLSTLSLRRATRCHCLSGQCG